MSRLYPWVNSVRGKNSQYSCPLNRAHLMSKKFETGDPTRECESVDRELRDRLVDRGNVTGDAFVRLDDDEPTRGRATGDGSPKRTKLAAVLTAVKVRPGSVSCERSVGCAGRP
jgi:hypothetical protein